ncbi:MAG TPA: hypothetical protein VLY21_07650 [Nitrososphaerales archaeon]|nr:hypothetical protein [Nitrososphaerales archaeon]
MQHLSKDLTKCSLCGQSETTPGTFPLVVGVGRVCLKCGMQSVRCAVCGQEVKLITSSRFQGRTLCLADHMKEIEKYRQHVVKTFDEETEPVASIFSKAAVEGPEGYTLLALRRARNSTHVWEAEYEKTEIFQTRCS